MLDTNVILAAWLSSQGASRQILLQGLSAGFVWLCSAPLHLEFESVLKRPEHLAAAEASLVEVDILLDSIAAAVTPVHFSYLWRPAAKDPNDEMVLETAINGQADFVVTMNLRHLQEPLQRFGIAALRPGAAVGRLRERRDPA